MGSITTSSRRKVSLAAGVVGLALLLFPVSAFATEADPTSDEVRRRLIDSESPPSHTPWPTIMVVLLVVGFIVTVIKVASD